MSTEAEKTIVNPVAAAVGQQQQVQMTVNTDEMSSNYSNFFRVTGTFEEVVLDFGLHSGLMATTGPEPIKVTDRVVLSFTTTKRLLQALQMAVARHEQMFGPIEVDPQKRIRPQAAPR